MRRIHTAYACLILVLLIAIATVTTKADDKMKSWIFDIGNGTFTNPLFYEEFSDPDMIRVGEYFYLTGTTMHSMPGLPILCSRDLVNWQFVAYAMDKRIWGRSFGWKRERMGAIKSDRFCEVARFHLAT
jgi:xylan 1,4-beta-xylosidase